ncbi:MAG: hypothetical protein NZM28_03415 [Fimbriimonadales bacterium]|nr:hypothetical protein [Fimbriimonadales bacterium]
MLQGHGQDCPCYRMLMLRTGGTPVLQSHGQDCPCYRMLMLHTGGTPVLQGTDRTVRATGC